MVWECPECAYENEPETQVCEACDTEREVEEDPRYAGYKVGEVKECEDIPKTQKLKQIKVDIGEGELVQVVTNAPNAKEGLLTVIATVGASVEADGETVVVKKTNVGGRPSNGMVCNGPMLGWTGGDAKAAVSLPEGTPIGSTPPSTRPRGK
eukprot:TRINITY_DN11100_c0_g1_i1.p2 TRINITY_DN11100_c0_g1~~TRINITY_DN11100_c0_g1_i1.p2  ORF type:complete len:152 (+),score=64.41 TRINITY_DN11100_c0_g1_i1:53-508(+)